MVKRPQLRPAKGKAKLALKHVIELTDYECGVVDRPSRLDVEQLSVRGTLVLDNSFAR